MKKLVFMGVVSLGLVGCQSTIMGEGVDQTVSFNGGGERQFTFIKYAGEYNVNNEDIRSALSRGLKRASKLPASKNRTIDGGKGSDLYITEGVEVYTTSSKPNEIFVAHVDNLNDMKDEQIASFKYQVEDMGDNYAVSMTCPNEYRDVAKYRGGLLTSDSFFKPGDAEMNFKAICSDAQPVINKTLYIKGEVNTEYSSEDVFANYKRLLDSSNYSASEVAAYDIEKAELFRIVEGDLYTNVAISVFPYRGGSKTLYSFKYEFEIDGEGNSTYNDNVIKAIKQRIVDIAND